MKKFYHIKNDIDLKELEKFGYVYIPGRKEYTKCIKYLFKKYRIIIPCYSTIKFEAYSDKTLCYYKITPKEKLIKDLINNNLVEVKQEYENI